MAPDLQPRVDPFTGDMLLFHSTPLSPYLEYSIIPSAPRSSPASSPAPPNAPFILNAPVHGMSSPKLMHDFSASHSHTIILDLPLHLDPLQLANPFGHPILHYDASGPSRFGIFPRYKPEEVRWFQSELGASCVFHTVCAWDDISDDQEEGSGGLWHTDVKAVNMLACRFNSASLIYLLGNIDPPPSAYNLLPDGTAELEKCELYYYRFDLSFSSASQCNNTITHEFALSAIPFEFPATHPLTAMGNPAFPREDDNDGAQYVYGCSLRDETFDTALGGTALIDCIVKMDARALVKEGVRRGTPKGGCVDQRTLNEILSEHSERDGDGDDWDNRIQVFTLPDGVYAQEPSFVPRADAVREDDGWILTYVFDERAGLDETTGQAKEGARSELWVIDARSMREVVARVMLPQRGMKQRPNALRLSNLIRSSVLHGRVVPYGFHGRFFSEGEILSQRPTTSIRSLLTPQVSLGAKVHGGVERSGSSGKGLWMHVRRVIEVLLAIG